VRRSFAQFLCAGKEEYVMNLDLFGGMEEFVLRERESSAGQTDFRQNNNGNNGISEFPKNTPLAMAYVPFQQWSETYDDDKALSRGTLFPELDLPFTGGGSVR